MDKTYVFDNGSDSGCGNNGMMGLIASLCNQRGLDPNMVMAMMNNRGNNGMDGGWGWWIIILLIFGWGGFGNGFGGGFGGRGSAQGLADLGNLINNDSGRDLIMQAIQGNANAISQLASTVHCDTNQLNAAIQNLSTQLCGIGNQIGLGQRDIIQAVLQGDNSLASQIANCCCENRLAICQQTNTLQNAINSVAVGQERGFSSVAYETQRQTCSIEKAIADSTAQILAGQKAAEFREIQREVQQLRDERTQYQMSALLQQQSQNLLGQLQPVAKPAYLTCSPYQTHFGYPCSNPWGINGGCCNNNGCCNNGCGC